MKEEKDKANLQSVFFRPWIGENYIQGINGKKLLILGESHICGGCQGVCGDLSIDDKTCRDFTSKAVKTFLSYKNNETGIRFAGWMNTYTKFSNVFLNKQLSASETISFWNSILFYSYVQYSTDRARVSPKQKEFSDSKNAFFEVLEAHQPDLIIAWGNRLWEQLPSGGYYKKLENNEQTRINDGKGFYYYKTKEKDIPIMYVYHPSSSRFNYTSHDLIRESLLKLER
ncbi:ABC-type Fe3+-hydroxamate transport system substrate-binding protein [Dysgonomonas sp. PH5-45]|uniref:hypothetical protein n=1 Tax=unclassified Dysgonomonas TaxID=2630389 RepID=UPI002476DF96|nr:MULTISPECIES: hypothetical protein [unclassified Dysgonomonas]MDH6354419.1 ABC-type Fe3+-hydroxamate transport system substrate-binding protein [Dysgonomonas sp. PH5-45]MDH6387318.1 ABC-type Fe3+-hydroxamate transport system substrate-binding protein [Dysgonomonas sp. PH5-37]